MNSVYLGVISFAVCAAVMPAAIYAAKWLGFEDRPDDRKKHAGPTPIFGGVAIFFTLVVVSLGNPGKDISVVLLFWFGLVLVLGVLDDYFDVSYRIRLFCQASIVVGIFLSTGLAVTEVGALSGGDVVRLIGYASVFFTVVGVLGAINSVNMMDGVDGLLGALAFVSVAAIIFFSTGADLVTQSITTSGISIVLGSLAAFLLFNSRFFGLRKALVFMGDSGSTTLGFIIVYLLIDNSQGVGSVFSPVLAGWLIGVPLLDASGVIVCRLMRGQSPFSPDRTHFHHTLLDLGYSVNKTVVLLTMLQICMILFATSTYALMPKSADAFLFWTFLALVAVRTVVATLLFKPGPQSVSSTSAPETHPAPRTVSANILASEHSEAPLTGKRPVKKLSEKRELAISD